MSEQPLSILNVGDYVIVHGGGAYLDKSLGKVERKTTTQIIVDGDRYNANSGRRLGTCSRFSRPWISVPLPGEIQGVRDQQRRREMLTRLHYIKWDSYTMEVLESVMACLPSPTKEPA